jgi:preprotein translocase subunit SecG
MNNEKRNTKLFDILSIVFLALILLTIVGGIILQRLDPSPRVARMGAGDHNFMQPGFTQTSPTGALVLTTGIILLTVGFVISVLMLLVRRNWLHRNPA